MPDFNYDMDSSGMQPEPMNEKQKLQAMQLQQLQQASQQFAPRLNQVLDLGTHIGMPVESPASQMTKLLLMMRRMDQPKQMPFDLSVSGGVQPSGLLSGDVRMTHRQLFDPRGRNALEFSGGVSGAYGNAPDRVREMQPFLNLNMRHRF